VLDLHRQLQARGVPLLVVVIPNKIMLYPEWATSSYAAANCPPLHPDFLLWKEGLAQKGVRILDLAGPLWEAKTGVGAGSDGPLYLALDTHWSPAGVARSADLIAESARPVLGPATPTRFPARVETIPEPAELVNGLDLPGGNAGWPLKSIDVVQVLHGTAPDVVGDDAPVLLFGDSFTMSYVTESDNSQSAGLAAQLMLRLGRGVQTIAQKGATPRVMLEMLSKKPGALARKRLVIMAVVDRSLGNPKAWEIIPLPPR
jgi:hypothetical protein